MNPEQVRKSIAGLARQYPGFRAPPLLVGESAAKMSCLGLAFPLDGSSPAAKIYYAPDGSTLPFPPGMPDALRQALSKVLATHRRKEWRLYDASVERAEKGGFTGRVLWALGSQERQDEERLSSLVRELLAELGHPGLSGPLLRLNSRLQDILRSELAPLWQLGGFLAPDGTLFRIKANFDADISGSAGRVEYDRDRARAATRFLLKECGADESGTEQMLSRLDSVMQGACNFYSWGFHAEGDRVEALKIYVRDGRSADLACSGIFREFFPNTDDACPAFRIPRPDAILCPFGWRYHGFYLEAADASFRTLKFYFLAPP